MKELSYGETIKVGDKIISNDKVFIVTEVDEFVHARRKNVTLILPLVYSEEFKGPDEFGIAYLAVRD